MTSFHLFDKPQCPFCWKIRLALVFNHIEWDSTTIDTNQKPDVLFKLNPRGTVPVLLVDDKVITDSVDIINHIARLPNVNKSFASEAALSLQSYSDNVIGVAIRYAIFMRRDQPESNWDPTVLDACQDKWIAILAHLNATFKGPWFLGDRPTVADCALIPRFALAGYFGLTGVCNFAPLKIWFNSVLSSGLIEKTGPRDFQKILVNRAKQCGETLGD